MRHQDLVDVSCAGDRQRCTTGPERPAADIRLRIGFLVSPGNSVPDVMALYHQSSVPMVLPALLSLWTPSSGSQY
jgi:hypothetical protein